MCPEVVTLDATHIAQAAQVLARAFQEHPLTEYIVPKVALREKVLTAYFRHVLDIGVRYGEVCAAPLAVIVVNCNRRGFIEFYIGYEADPEQEFEYIPKYFTLV